MSGVIMFPMALTLGRALCPDGDVDTGKGGGQERGGLCDHGEKKNITNILFGDEPSGIRAVPRGSVAHAERRLSFALT